MSLINDALKRAKQVQDETPPPPVPEPEFRPVDPDQADPIPKNLMVPIIFSAVGLIALIIIWRSLTAQPGDQSTASTVVAARSTQAATVEPQAEPQVDPDIAAAVIEAAPRSVPASSVTAATPKPAVVPAAEVVVPADPRLQAVVYSPKRPSAIIDGRTVFVGDRISDFRVARITKTSVTLTGESRQLMLKLP